MHVKTVLWLGALTLATSAWAQNGPTPPTTVSAPAAAVQLQTVTVHGQQPGPALWEVRRGDHTLWIVGTLTPLPKHAEWQWAKLEQALARSSELLEAPSARLQMPHSLFARLALQPSAKLNPGGATLTRLLPPDMYERWVALRHQYLGDDDALEYMRPIIVAQQLYEKALAASDLSNDVDVSDMVEKLARHHGTRIIGVRYQLIVTRAPPTTSADSDQQQGIDCLNETMQLVEHDLPKLTQRANAWSTGDMSTLQSLMPQKSYEPCIVSSINGDFEKQLHIPDLPQRIEAAWMEAAEEAILRNRNTVAILSMDQLLSTDGYLAKLKQRGYIVRAPDGVQQ
ncbi:TraB/GumN family protein [Dyella terrae]|uniref:TraB/GumN family protein n=1 Tax=Dyella terrae TaxID=522259 RepID=UPI001EFE8D7B|nr:TraB/GumN family protein [Dyella terrae]ULU23937.1 TraB/GumN family protein [Dyella terrae]